MLSSDISYTSNSYNYQNNPTCVIFNRYGINSLDVNNDTLLIGDNIGYISMWDLDCQSQLRNKKLDTGIINVKFANNCVLSQSKGELSLLNIDFDIVLDCKDSNSCTFAKFVLLNNKSIIAHPNSGINGDISIISITSNKLIEINHIKITSGKDLGSLHVLKGITDFQFIASYEIGSLFTFDIRKLDNPVSDPVYINTISPIHSVEFFDNVIYVGTAEGELYSANGGNVKKCYVTKSISQAENIGIGNILYNNGVLVMGCWDGSVRVLDSISFVEKIIFHGHSSTVTDLYIDFINNVLFTSGVDGRVCIWDMK